MTTVEYAKNPFYNDPDNITVLLTVKFDNQPTELPFTATPYDCMDYGRQLCADAKAGVYGPIGSWQDNPHYSPPYLNQSSAVDGIINVPYSHKLNAICAGEGYAISPVGFLPSGLSITNNELVGTPTQAGLFKITVRIADNKGNVGESSINLLIMQYTQINGNT